MPITAAAVPTSTTGEEIQRGTCAECTRCLGFISDGEYICGCTHPWHAHMPVEEELAAFAARYRRGANPSSKCCSYYPITLPPQSTTVCHCGELPMAHQLRSTIAPSLPIPPGPVPPSGAPLPSRGGALVLNILSHAPDGTAAPLHAAQRRITEARDLRESVSVTARANAPQPTLTGQPATTAVTGPLYGYPSAPTSHSITGLGVPQASTLKGKGFLLVVIPVKFVKVQNDTAVPGVAYRLQNKLDELLDRLQEHSLVIQYKASSEPAQQKGGALVRHMHEAITAHLKRFRYYLPGTELVPPAPVQLDYPLLPWVPVWYSTTGSDKKNMISDLSKIPVTSLNIASLAKSPFGTGSTRPHFLADKRPVILIMPRSGDLMGLNPLVVRPRDVLASENALLHRCIGRRVMDGLLSDSDVSQPSNLTCRVGCTERCDPSSLYPIPATPTNPPVPPSASLQPGTHGVHGTPTIPNTRVPSITPVVPVTTLLIANLRERGKERVY